MGHGKYSFPLSQPSGPLADEEEQQQIPCAPETLISQKSGEPPQPITIAAASLPTADASAVTMTTEGEEARRANLMIMLILLLTVLTAATRAYTPRAKAAKVTRSRTRQVPCWPSSRITRWIAAGGMYLV